MNEDVLLTGQRRPDPHAAGRRLTFLADHHDARPALTLPGPRLPDGNGLRVPETVETAADLGQIPVVVLTSSDAPEDRRASALGTRTSSSRSRAARRNLGANGRADELLDRQGDPRARSTFADGATAPRVPMWNFVSYSADRAPALPSDGRSVQRELQSLLNRPLLP